MRVLLERKGRAKRSLRPSLALYCRHRWGECQEADRPRDAGCAKRTRGAPCVSSPRILSLNCPPSAAPPCRTTPQTTAPLPSTPPTPPTPSQTELGRGSSPI